MKPKKKKSPKAVTLLTRVETLLSDVIDQCSDIEKSVDKNVRELLTSAQKSISSAIDFVVSATPSSEVPQRAAKSKAKPSVKARKPLTAPAAKKRALKA
jgi:hypothetical protein